MRHSTRGRAASRGVESSQAFAARDPDLPADQVEAGDHLGHRMLDLQPGVHLEEVERALGVEQELHRCPAVVADGARDGGRGGGHARAGRRGSRPRPATPRRFSDGAAGSSTRGRRSARPCRGRRRGSAPRRGADAQVARGRCAVAEGRSASDRARRRPPGSSSPGAVDDHACLSRHRRRGLDDERESRAWPPPRRLSGSRGRMAVGAGTTGTPAGMATARAPPLVAHGRDRLRARTNERQIRVVAGGGEARVLGQESVTWMDGIGAARVATSRSVVDVR